MPIKVTLRDNDVINYPTAEFFEVSANPPGSLLIFENDDQEQPIGAYASGAWSNVNYVPTVSNKDTK